MSSPENRPNTLQRVQAMSLEQLAALLEKSEALTGLARNLSDQNRVLRHNIDWLKRQLFGSTSERRAAATLTLAQQLYLGEILEPAKEPPPKTTTVAQHDRKQRKKQIEFVSEDSQLKFDETVPRQIIEVPNPDIEGIDQAELELVDIRKTYRLAQRRGPYVVLEYQQKVYKRKDTKALSVPPIPPAIYEKSCADVSFLSNMVIDKFQYHLPLHRQHQRLEESGVYLNRSTLTKLVHRTGHMLELVYQSLLSSILNSAVLSIDETPTPAGREKGKMGKGYFWVLYGDQAEVAFTFAPTRARTVIDSLLQNFQGTLLSDGYSAYSSFMKVTERVVHAQCWAHVRRKFFEAQKFAQAECNELLGWIRLLYEVERQCKDPASLARKRKHLSAPLVEKFFAFLRSEMDRTALLPSNPYVQAAAYALEREHPLKVFLENPLVPIDNNHVERSLRPQALGRKNWLFHVTEEGARCAGIFYSLIQSCVAADVDPSAYLTDILQRVSIHPAEDVHLLIPRNWKLHFGSNPMRSVVAS